jgi:hypothetical protein
MDDRAALWWQRDNSLLLIAVVVLDVLFPGLFL